MKRFAALISIVLFIGTLTLFRFLSGAQKNIDYKPCIALLKGKNYPAAFKCYKKQAKHDIPQAKLALAMMYYKGLGTEQNYQKSFKLYKNVARGSNRSGSFAQSRLGEMYMLGVGVKQDCKKTLKLWKKAAAKNNPWAIEDLRQWSKSNYKCPPTITTG